MKRRNEFAVQTLGGQDLLVPLGPRVMDMNAIVLLNPTARCVWDLLSEDRSLESLTAAVTERFEVDGERACADIKVFLDEIAALGLLET